MGKEQGMEIKGGKEIKDKDLGVRVSTLLSIILDIISISI
jgi:hypothetical protein